MSAIATDPNDLKTVSKTENVDTPSTDKCVTVIFNPVSGTGDPDTRRRLISDALERHGYTCQIVATSLERGAKQLAEEAVRDGADLLTVAGGDGTVMEVMSALVGTDIPIAVVPSGTGNLLSVNLGVPGAVPEAIDVALAGKPYTLDLARAKLSSTPDRTAESWRYFAIMGGMGLDARMIADADRQMKRRLGVLAYLWAIVKNLPRKSSRVLVSVDGGRPIRRRAKTVIVANMGKVIGGLEAMPTALPDDGRLDVGLVMSESVGQGLRLLWMAILGRAQDAPELDVYQGRRVTIRTLHPEPVELDGEDYGTANGLEVEIVPRAVRIMLPVDAPAAKDASATATSTARPLWPALLGVIGVVAAVIMTVARRRRK